MHVTSKHRGLISEGPPRASALRGVACSTGLGDGGGALAADPCSVTIRCARGAAALPTCAEPSRTKHEAKKRARRHASCLQGFRERDMADELNWPRQPEAQPHCTSSAAWPILMPAKQRGAYRGCPSKEPVRCWCEGARRPASCRGLEATARGGARHRALPPRRFITPSCSYHQHTPLSTSDSHAAMSRSAAANRHEEPVRHAQHARR